jgi:hypothetical protein
MTLQSRTSNTASTFASYAVPRAKRRPLTVAERQMVGALLGTAEMVIEVWREALDNAVPVAPAVAPCPRPKPGDVWTDTSGMNLVILPAGVEMGLMDQRFRCFVQQKTA